MKSGFIVIPNWEKFQHYKDRRPAWIKLYIDLRTRQEWHRLSFRSRGLLVGIWMAYAESGLKLGASPAELGRILGDSSVRTRDLTRLEKAGFIEIALAPRYQNASLEVREKNKELKSFDLDFQHLLRNVPDG